MLADPGEYLATYRESVLTSLVEEGKASQSALAIVDDFSRGYVVDPMRYADDWTAVEGGEASPKLAVSSQALENFHALTQADKDAGLHATVLRMIGGEHHDSIIEVGPGAGGLSPLLAAQCDQLVLIDSSLRSLLRSQRACRSAKAGVAAIVGDAENLEMASDCASVVVAANLVDLLDEPERFLLSVSRWLVRKGDFILTTPEPSLGTESDDALRELMESLEFKVDAEDDGIPWIRMHSARYSQLYWLQALRTSILS
jgi:SAM-dependent methyltransferase